MAAEALPRLRLRLLAQQVVRDHLTLALRVDRLCAAVAGTRLAPEAGALWRATDALVRSYAGPGDAAWDAQFDRLEAAWERLEWERTDA